ncbi:lysozyme inhibitor LprI family protein [Hyphomicrobium sp. MC1]|uniref:lysozyme inhibitor LprI family protein n=1 Tax=Hyphomicrobium sp. (strain MC1) TaxID=717785 RepID=UPI000213E1C7|nr:hypothetical protein [Hyphomicrobium sp. MC1]CCB65862.1 exported protein of unknown function [Hyphomicrobium sp. MC1]
MIAKFLTFGVSVVALHLVGGAAMGASFDCRPYMKVRACPEAVICETSVLSQQDDLLARNYDFRMRNSSTRAAVGLRDEQRLWIQQRKNCGCDASCISDLYTKRLKELVDPVDTSASNDASNTAPYVSHWTCTSEGADPRRYALKIVEESYTDQAGNTALRQGSIELMAKNQPSDTDQFPIERGAIETFRITSIADIDVCAKYGWTAEDGNYSAVFCGATQGIGSIEVIPKGATQPILNAQCDSADVN